MGGERFAGSMSAVHKTKELNIQTLRRRHLGSKRAPKTRTRAWHLAGLIVFHEVISFHDAVFPPTIHWFLPANGFNSNLPLPPEKESISLQTPVGRIPRKGSDCQVWVMCSLWTKSCGQQHRCYNWLTRVGCWAHCLQESKSHMRKWQQHVDPWPAQWRTAH